MTTTSPPTLDICICGCERYYHFALREVCAGARRASGQKCPEDCQQFILASPAPNPEQPQDRRQVEDIRPSYYTDAKIQALDVIDDWGLDFYLGNVVKYIQRAGKKTQDSHKDLRKAMTYIKLKLEREINEQPSDREGGKSNPTGDGH